MAEMNARYWEAALLEGLRLRGDVQIAADFAGVSRRTVQNHWSRDPEFKKRCEDALSEHRLDRVRRMLG